MKSLPLLSTLLSCCVSVLADGPADNVAASVRRIPPPGIPISPGERTELEAGAAQLAREITLLQGSLTNQPALAELMPDVEIFHKAVDWALRYDEFYKSNEVAIAKNLLRQGADRAAELRAGKASWLTATGLVVRGYRSRIDGSVQPYGLVTPVSFARRGQPKRLDFWFHGRGEQLTELSFLTERQKSAGEFLPANAFVLHTYGRYCNGQRFAGEIDAFEALEHARRYYPIDENRLVVRGFSLGGAACWHMAVHHAGLWAAAAPGAGFSETADFLKVFQNEPLKPTWYEQKLWHMYDATDHALNLFNCPVVAYSGEIDKQKQAADKMAEAMAAENLSLAHIIGPGTAHKYHPDARVEVSRRIDRIAATGRTMTPLRIRFVTYTLRYPEMGWVRIEGLEQHWEQARVDAAIRGQNEIEVSTTNVLRLRFSMAAGECPFDPGSKVQVTLDGRKMEVAAPLSDRSWQIGFQKRAGQTTSGWMAADLSAPDDGLRKKPGLQGPIDDAFMDSFLFVRPTGKSLHEKVGQWVEGEMAHAVEHWRRQFRGDVRVKEDTAVSEEDIAAHNLVLWGDPASNRVLAKIISRLPIQWTAQGVVVGDKNFAPDHHAPLMVYPNPLNPKRYVVLNSGFTFREYDYLNNARQTAKLPDYAVVDLNTPTSSRLPGEIVAAGFFGERWELKP